MKEKNLLPVSEVFYSIQGEGQTVGIPAVFLRLGGCNLLCESSNWVCDTIEVWRKSKATYFENVLEENHVNQIVSNKAHLVITGGEPMLHQEAIINYLKWFERTYHFLPTVEIETNGTITPNQYFLDYHDIYFNVSPKLSSAGSQNSFEQRVNIDALQTFYCKAKEPGKTILKFVISCEKDMDEVFEDFLTVMFQMNFTGLNQHRIVLMPAGSSIDELDKTRLMVIEFCKKFGFRFSDRSHIVAWNKKTGV